MATKKSSKVVGKKSNPSTIEDYLEIVPPAALPALIALRAATKAATPKRCSPYAGFSRTIP